MLELDGDTLRGRGDVGRLAPQEIAGFVSAQKAVGSFGRLVLGHLERIGVDRRRRTVGIITDDVDVRILVPEVDRLVGNPLAVGLVVDITDVVGLVALDNQLAGNPAVIVDNIDAHTVTVAETFVVDTRGGNLFDLVEELYGIGLVDLDDHLVGFIRAGSQHDGEDAVCQ